MNNKNFNIEKLFAALILVAVAFFGGFHCGKGETSDKPKADTVVVERWDTISIEKPTEVVRYIVRRDTIHATDTAVKIIFDSVSGGSAAIIPIESVVYKDSTENARYTAYLSGYRAALDSICINCLQTEKIITITEREKARRFGVGVQLGVGLSAQGVAAPYVGVGVHYRLW